MANVQSQPGQILVSVPKRLFKHAVDRNRIKRQIREAYRLNKQMLTDAIMQRLEAEATAYEGITVTMAFIWLSPSHLSTEEVEKRMKSLLAHISSQLSTRNS